MWRVHDTRLVTNGPRVTFYSFTRAVCAWSRPLLPLTRLHPPSHSHDITTS
uniref:Uncharacterized protein n=1 Tax=Anguilla anguilla TaxID=7936 RepID=A0A0E9RCN0_ANGAN